LGQAGDYLFVHRRKKPITAADERYGNIQGMGDGGKLDSDSPTPNDQ
jgi:hypothetical protein